jgi:flagellar basal-body rod protein FlgG
MSAGMEIGAIGMRVQQQALDSIAGNVTNINTPTYKRSALRFSELLVTPPIAGSDGISAVDLSTQPMVDQQGQLQVTGNSLDLAINGTGFIELMGSGGRTMLWRGGTLQVQEDGTLATSSGYQLKSTVTVPKGATNLTINPDGKVYATLTGSATATQIGQINLVDVPASASIERMDGGVYQVSDSSQLVEAAPGEESLGYLVQGEQEQSNVDLNTEMVNLLVSQRAYAASAQVVQAADQLYSLANSLRR